MARFSIRDILWLMIVVGLGVALYVERSNAEQLRQISHKFELVTDQIMKLGFYIRTVTLNDELQSVEVRKSP